MSYQISQAMSNELEEGKPEGTGAGPGRLCPACREGVLRRTRRKGWMALVPFSKYYSCSKCKSSFLRFFDSIHLKVRGAGGSANKSTREAVIISLAILSAVYICYRIVIHLYESGFE